MAKASFAAGCFWGIEQAFRNLPGVINTAVGYMGGTTADPTYRQVCSGDTGHAETVQVEYDPAKISYEALLKAFWEMHNPTTLNRQGPDHGTQYRSVIFYHTPEQQKAAVQSKQELERSKRYRHPVVTEIIPAPAFHRAEEYHQCYLQKQGRSCH